MKTTAARTAFPGKNLLRIVFVTALILSVPLISMQFSEGVDWRLSDFVIIGTLLIGIGVAYELAAPRVRDTRQRLVIGAILLVALLLIWAELAVGIFGTPFAGS